ncbi:hypothetical protein A2V49_00260, partial [candidate division WWE3 bacterium RBG_19FT_COMBO_34_6]
IEDEKQPEEANVFIRALIAAVFFIIGFNFSYSSFFNENPLYGVNYLAETLISITCALFGFYIVPKLFFAAKNWIKTLIRNTVEDIVKLFWDRQTKKINEKKREKQKLQAMEEREKLAQQIANSVVVDTSVLVDGRIYNIVKTGFFQRTLVIPLAVMNELHLISDSKDKLKRERGRRGLDMIKRLRSKIKVVSPVIKTKEHEVDKIILQFAKENKLPLMTQDYNLDKLARATGVKVLNINELVEAVKQNVTPGEKLSLQIIHAGKERSQGVGYLVDGTMIIVEDAKDLLGQTVDIKVTKPVQSPAGKIIFATLYEPAKENAHVAVRTPPWP